VTSSLLVGKVNHRRATPTTYALEHDVWYVALDLDDLDGAFAATRVMGRNRRSPLSFRDRDYMPAPAVDVGRDMREHLAQSGIRPAQIELITCPRVIGYEFNPASFYLCRDEAGEIIAVVVEVHNTFGERHLYTLESAGRVQGFSAQMDKRFYVSPFIGESGMYRVTVRENGDRLAIGINLRSDGSQLLATSLSLRRIPLSTRNIVRLALRYPLVPHKTIAAIHWHALRLWLRRVPWHRHVSAPPRGPLGGTVAGHGAAR
jgi:DUF1365 family protein